MAVKPVIFIHHDQQGGGLSQDSVVKAWGHVSRRSWQEKPQQLIIKIYDRQDDNSTPGRTSATNDQSKLLVPYNSLQQAYASKSCFRPIRPPEFLVLIETNFFLVFQQIQKSVPHRDLPTYSVDLQRQILKIGRDLSLVPFVIRCGLDGLARGHVTQAFACFESALQMIQRSLAENVIDKLEILVNNIIKALGYIISRNARDVARLFLERIAAIAAVSGGTNHPVSVLARNLLMMEITPTLLLALSDVEHRSSHDVLTSLGVNSPGSTHEYSKDQMELDCLHARCEILGVNYPVDEAQQASSKVFARIQSHGIRQGRQFWTSIVAHTYLEQQRFVEAAFVLSDAFSDLQEYLAGGWDPSKGLIPARDYVRPPLSVMGMVRRLHLLGRALAGQGEHESAEVAFQSAIFAGEKYLKSIYDVNAPVIEAQKAYSKFLFDQNRIIEAEEMERKIDIALAEFVLTP